MRKPAFVKRSIQWRLFFILCLDGKSKTDQASIRTRVMDVAVVRCMLGSDQLRRCNLNGRLRCRRLALLLTRLGARACTWYAVAADWTQTAPLSVVRVKALV